MPKPKPKQAPVFEVAESDASDDNDDNDTLAHLDVQVDDSDSEEAPPAVQSTDMQDDLSGIPTSVSAATHAPRRGGGAQRRSGALMLRIRRQSARTTNSLWAHAPNAGLVETAKTATGVRPRRLLTRHAVRIAASGGAVYASAVGRQIAESQGVGFPKEKTPWLPTVTKGGAMLLELFLAAYAQSGIHKASHMRRVVGRRRKLDKYTTQSGFTAINKYVFSDGVYN